MCVHCSRKRGTDIVAKLMGNKEKNPPKKNIYNIKVEKKKEADEKIEKKQQNEARTAGVIKEGKKKCGTNDENKEGKNIAN